MVYDLWFMAYYPHYLSSNDHFMTCQGGILGVIMRFIVLSLLKGHVAWGRYWI
jgi:hypothetical protein